jgi:hypothetical protein
LSACFSGTEKVEFFSVLNCEKFDKFEAAFPEKIILKQVQVYDGIFSCALLKNELSFMAQKT